MGFFDIFRRAPAIREAAALADFIDGNAAFLIQKGMYEYSRARAGHYAKVLMSEPEFLRRSRSRAGRDFRSASPWSARWSKACCMPRSATTAAPGSMRCARWCCRCSTAIRCRRRSAASAWEEARSSSARRLDQVGLHPPKFVKDIPVPLAEAYFDMMPIHEKLRAPDFPPSRNYLRVSLINIHDAADRRLDVAGGGAVAACE